MRQSIAQCENWRVPRVLSAAPLFLLLAACAARCQAPGSGSASTEVHKEWELGSAASAELEKRDGTINDPEIADYLQHIETSLANAASLPPMQLRFTRNAAEYAVPLENGLVYLSAGMLLRLDSEAELAGLLAHELGHNRRPCVLSGRHVAPGVDQASAERQATTAAVAFLKATGYDPEGVLDLLSKLAYEHPKWAEAIVPQDLLDLRAGLESDALPAAGYQLGSSEFRRLRSRLEATLGLVPQRTSPPPRPTLTPR